ncbi:MAG: Veg family protein [Bacilli bacterium]
MDIVTRDRRNTIKDKIKTQLKVGKSIKIKNNLGRNKYETFEAIIKELYDNVFLIETLDKKVKCFTYGDILTKTIIIENIAF